jgi:hypothetical protein
VFEKAWLDAVHNNEKRNQEQVALTKENDKEIDKYLECILKTEIQLVKSKYEEKIAGLVEQNNLLNEKMSFKLDYNIPYRTALDKMTLMLKSPYELWTSIPIEQKVIVYNFFWH